MAGCIAHARNGRISTSGENSDVNIVFLDPDFLKDAKMLTIWSPVLSRLIDLTPFTTKHFITSITVYCLGVYNRPQEQILA